MLDELTPEQALELFHYHAIEPFGEVREDYRMARLMKFYYDSNRGKQGRDVSIGEFSLYEDIAKAAFDEDPASEASLLRALSHG